MSLTPMFAGDVPVHLLERRHEERGEEEPRHDALLRARHGDATRAGVRAAARHATLLSRSASSSTRSLRESFLRHSSESGVPSRLPAFQRAVEVEQRLPHRALVVGRNDHARASLAHELRGRAVGRDDGEDRPLGGEVLEDLPRQDALAAAARLRDQEEQRLGVPLQLERAAARDVAEELDPVAEAERLRVLAVGGAEVAGEARDHVVEAGVGERAQERLRVALAVEVAGVRDPEAVARVVLEAREVVEVAAVGDRDDLALRLERAHLLGDRVRHRDDRVRLRRDELPHSAGGLLLQPRELRLVAAAVRMGGERVAQVGDPGRAGRPLHGGAEEVERRRRRGGEHDVDPLAAHEPDRDRRRERAPGSVLVRHEQLAPEQRRLRAESRDALLLQRAAPTDGPRAARRSARGGSTPASAARAPRRGTEPGTSGASTWVSIPSAGRCVANLSGRWTPPPPPGGKWRVTSRTFNGATVLAGRRNPEGDELAVRVGRAAGRGAPSPPPARSARARATALPRPAAPRGSDA